MSELYAKRPKALLVSDIKLSPDEGEACAVDEARLRIKRAGVNPAQLSFRIYKKSIDARKKQDIKLVYSVAAYASDVIKVTPEKLGALGIKELPDEDINIELGKEKMTAPPLVVGMGPAGMLAALLLAEHGYAPIVIDRGDNVAERSRINKRFIETGALDTESNVQFGAGGAGTFSDGKLMTRINDPKIAYVLRRFCEFGAPEQILTSARPHIGTDNLVTMVDNLLSYVEGKGGTLLYRCRLDGLRENPSGGITAYTTRGEIECSSVILATGHSARDTYKMLIDSGYAVDAKAFSVGVRVEHRREDIDRALYGDMAGHPALGSAEYHLSDTRGERGVYTFCMCPGGTVVAGASEEGGVVVNGMSNFLRDGRNSNSAVLVSVNREDYGATPMGAIEFQRRIERLAFAKGGSDYSAPIQTMGDFMKDKCGSEPSSVLPTYRDGKVRCADINEILPPFVCEGLKRGFSAFERKLEGFSMGSALITAAETRTSAPVRILRTEDMTAIGHHLVYPSGEGAGYAGGITSAAVDGIRSALALMRRFAPLT
ncbi:MAG: hypothetical protein J6S10_03435 [Clostridia bacterium]|nr:hypothetical protein [Clostridia bacterium]